MLAPIAASPLLVNNGSVSVTRLASWLLALATPAVVLLAVAGWLPSGDAGTSVWIGAFEAVAVIAPAVVGLAIAQRRPHNPIAWVLP